MTVLRHLIMTASIACSASAGVALAAAPALNELVGRAMSAAPDAQHGRILYLKHCTGCHGQSAWGNGTKEIPALAGQHYSYTLVQLKNFAAGHRGQVEPPVIDFTAGLSPEDQIGIADYLSKLEPTGSR